MRMLFGGRSLRANLVLAALVVCISQAGWAQDNSSAENKDDVPGADATTADDRNDVPGADATTADDRNDVPGADATTAASPDEMFASVIDLPFKQYVDITLLRSAYSNGDASSLIDIGLQLQEGERVLQRSHRAFEARQILDIAVRFATAQQDTGSLDRLAKAAELSGNKALVESVNVARQLASQQRAAVPPIPEASETLTLEEIAVLDSIPRQLEKARAIGSRAALLALQSRLEQSPLEQGEYRAYLEAQLVDAISETSDSEEEGDAAIKALEALSGETRGITFAPLGMSVANPRTKAVRTAYYQGAQPAYEVSSGSVTYLDLNGFKHTVPKNTIEGLRAVYGSIYVNYGTFMEIQVDAQGNALIQNGQTVRAFPRRALEVRPGRENEVLVWKRRPEGGWVMDMFTISMNEALTWALEMPNGESGPMRRGCTPLISVTGAAMLPERVIAKKGSSFSMLDFKKVGFGFTELGMVEAAGGGHLRLRTTGLIGKVKDIFTKAGPTGSATISEIVRAGGKFTTVQEIVAAGGGNIVAAGGGNIVAAGGGNIVAAGGGNIVAAGGGNLQWMIAEAVSESIAEDIKIGKMDFIIGKGGAGLGALLGNDASSLSAVSQSIDIGLTLALNAQNVKTVIVEPNFSFKPGAGYKLLSGTATNPDFRNAKLWLK